jgi:benzoyl-CoA reductase/2-hydroxyglutaryl-CoA dehydratase subunit BcrC/BadD/HgdB
MTDAAIFKPEGVSSRFSRLLAKARERAAVERDEALASLRARSDRLEGLEYFFGLLEEADVTSVETRAERPAIRLLCNQIPLELILAAGFQPFKLTCGSLAEAAFSGFSLPALACPAIKGILTTLASDPALLNGPLIVPSACDWVTKFGEIMGFLGESPGPALRLELPRFKRDPDSQKRWLCEIYKLKAFLEGLKKAKISRKDLLKGVEEMNYAYAAAARLKAARRAGRLPSIYFLAAMGSFFLDKPSRWAEKTLSLALSPEPIKGFSPKIFLAGSPIYFPNFKLPNLLEDAGLFVVADDLCSSEKIFPPGEAPADSSESGLLALMSGRYHQGCLCPIFSDDKRRVNDIIGQMSEADFKGVVYAVLKGCHPYDLKSFTEEPALKAAGLRFLRLETDYAAGDGRNLLTRLEAFGQSLMEA